MRTAVVGLGEIGQHHLRAVLASPSAELVAVCDLDGDLARRSAHGAAPYTELAAMLAGEDLEALCICLPHSLHAEAALAGIDAGCHIVLEKPISTDVESAEQISAAAASAGLLVAVSHNQIFFAPHRRVAKLIEAGELGKLRSLYARLWIGDRYRGWREQPDVVGGGLVMDAGVHRIYMLRALGGPVARVRATMDVPRAEESFVVTLEHLGGTISVAQGSYFAPAGLFDDRLDVVGELGVASVSGCEAYFEGDLVHEPQLRLRLDGAWREEQMDDDSWDASVARSVEDGLEALAHGRQPTVGATAATEVMRIIEAAYQSAENGSTVELEVATTANGAS